MMSFIDRYHTFVMDTFAAVFESSKDTIEQGALRKFIRL